MWGFLCGQPALQLHCTWGNSAVPEGQEAGDSTRREAGVAGGGNVLLANTLVSVPLACATGGWAGKNAAGVDLHPAGSYPDTAATPAAQGAASASVTYFLGGKGGARGRKGSLLAPVPGRSLLSADGSGRGRSRSLEVRTSGMSLGPDVMIRRDITLAFRLTRFTGMSLRLPLFRGVKHFCCKPSKRRYCLRVEQKRLWKICQESACALLVPKHGRLKKKN